MCALLKKMTVPVQSQTSSAYSDRGYSTTGVIGNANFCPG